MKSEAPQRRAWRTVANDRFFEIEHGSLAERKPVGRLELYSLDGMAGG